MVQLKVEEQAQQAVYDKYRTADGSLRPKYVKLKAEVLAAIQSLDPFAEGKVLAYSDIRAVLHKLDDYKVLPPKERPSNTDIKMMCAELVKEGKVID